MPDFAVHVHLEQLVSRKDETWQQAEKLTMFAKAKEYDQARFDKAELPRPEKPPGPTLLARNMTRVTFMRYR